VYSNLREINSVLGTNIESPTNDSVKVKVWHALFQGHVMRLSKVKGGKNGARVARYYLDIDHLGEFVHLWDKVKVQEHEGDRLNIDQDKLENRLMTHDDISTINNKKNGLKFVKKKRNKISIE